MIRPLLSLLPLYCAAALIPAGRLPAEPPGENPWDQPREIGQFSALLNRSPFSLPTAEASSPLADRFSLTGAFLLDGEQVIFVMDKNTQARSRVTSTPNDLGLRLVEYLPASDPRKMRATVRFGAETATIAFKEPAPASPDGTAQRTPAAPLLPPAAASSSTPARPEPALPRRVIRHTTIFGSMPATP